LYIFCGKQQQDSNSEQVQNPPLGKKGDLPNLHFPNFENMLRLMKIGRSIFFLFNLFNLAQKPLAISPITG
jgi:hypothetical protein